MKKSKINKNNKIKVICVHNSRKILNNNLIKSLKFQNNELFNLKIINNKKGNSLPKIFNEQVNHINEKYILFCHQDLQIIEKNFFEKLNHFIKRNELFGVIGFIGIGDDGSNYGKIIDRQNYYNNESKLKNIKIFDECCFLVKTDFIKEVKFNQNLSGFHLYCADLCIRSNILGLNNYCPNLFIWHNSVGTNLKDFRKTLSKMEYIYPKYYTNYIKKFHNIHKEGIKTFFRLKLIRKIIKIFFKLIFKIINLKKDNILILDTDLDINENNISLNKFTNSLLEITEKNIEINNHVKNQSFDYIYSKQLLNNDSYRFLKKLNDYYVYQKVNLLVITKNSIVSPSAKDRILSVKYKFDNIFNVKAINFTSSYTDVIKYQNILLTIPSYLKDYFVSTLKIIFSLNKADIIFIQYTITPLLIPFAEIYIKLFYRNKLIIYDIDDLIHKKIDTYKIKIINYLKLHTYGSTLLLSISNCNTFGNKELFKIAKGKNNFLNLTPKFNSIKRKKITNKVFIGYIGFKATFDNLNFISKALTNLLNKYSFLEIIIIGSEKKYLNHKRCHYWKYNLNTEKRFYNKIHIGINPLENNLVNLYKSGGKLIGYYNHNCLGISSNIGICKFITKKNNGILINNLSNKSWEKSISKILDNKRSLNNYLRTNSFFHFNEEMYFKNLNKIMQRLLTKNFPIIG